MARTKGKKATHFGKSSSYSGWLDLLYCPCTVNNSPSPTGRRGLRIKEVFAISVNDINDRFRFDQKLRQLSKEPACERMRGFLQHKGNTTYQHCFNVARYSFYLAEKFGWKVNEDSLARGAMLHDYYLYNTTQMEVSDYRHGVDHPRIALENARREYKLNKKEENIIRSHMWPLTLFHPPRSKEAILVSLADKYCALREMYGDTKDINPGVHTRWIRPAVRRQVARLFAWT